MANGQHDSKLHTTLLDVKVSGIRGKGTQTNAVFFKTIDLVRVESVEVQLSFPVFNS